MLSENGILEFSNTLLDGKAEEGCVRADEDDVHPSVCTPNDRSRVIHESATEPPDFLRCRRLRH